MNRIGKIIAGVAVIIALCAWPAAAGAAVYHVSPKGSDSNPGNSPSRPYATIARALKAVGPGDVILLEQGVYYESGLILSKSGRPKAPICLSAAKNRKPVIDGSKGGEENGLTITGNHYLIEGITVRNMGSSGLATEDATGKAYQDITIRDSVFHDNAYAGLELNAVDGFKVENVAAFNNHYGLNIGASKDGRISSCNGTVTDSKFYDQTTETGHGLAVNQGHDIRIAGCQAYHNRIHGFDVSDWPKKGALSYNIVLERNVSHDNGVAGFSINSDSHHVTYRNNAAWHNGAAWAGRGDSSGFGATRGAGMWPGSTMWLMKTRMPDSASTIGPGSTYAPGTAPWSLKTISVSTMEIPAGGTYGPLRFQRGLGHYHGKQ